MDHIGGYLEVGLDNNNEIVINHPDLLPDADGVGHIVFSPDQARNLARLLDKHAMQAETNIRKTREEEQRKKAEAIPVDYSARTLLGGQPVTPDHKEIDPSTGMQKSYVVLSAAERSKGFVRPVRDSYRHLKCGAITTMGRELAETYARCPTFYSGTMCRACCNHYPVGEDGEFVWLDDGTKVGT